MPKTLDEAAAEIRAILPTLKPGFYVKPSDGIDDCILVGNSDLAFAVTRNEIDDNLHIERAKKTFPFLLSSLAQHYAVLACETDANTARSIVDAYGNS